MISPKTKGQLGADYSSDCKYLRFDWIDLKYLLVGDFYWSGEVKDIIKVFMFALEVFFKKCWNHHVFFFPLTEKKCLAKNSKYLRFDWIDLKDLLEGDIYWSGEEKDIIKVLMFALEVFLKNVEITIYFSSHRKKIV